MITRRALLAAAAQIPEAFRGDPAFEEVKDDPALPRVLIIGDSISIGYTAPVRKLLAGKANVHRIMANGGPTTNGLKNLDQWLGAGRWDVIHFNFGLHDLRIMEDGKHQVPLEEYEKNLAQLAARLKATGARLIWCSTTPVPAGKLSPPRRSADVPLYNEAAARVMKSAGIPVNDLYNFCLPVLDQIQRPENVHFTPEGSRRLAGEVARAILGALGR